MRPAMPVVSLLFLLLLLAETSRGIRLEVEFLALLHKIIHKERFKEEGVAAEVSCKEDEHCSEMDLRRFKILPLYATKEISLLTNQSYFYNKQLVSRRIRKLMTKAMPTSQSKRSSEKGVGHHSTKEIAKSKRPEDFHVEPPETHPDILDIAGMDYSPARRKPPIHN